MLESLKHSAHMATWTHVASMKLRGMRTLEKSQAFCAHGHVDSRGLYEEAWNAKAHKNSSILRTWPRRFTVRDMRMLENLEHSAHMAT